MGAENCNPNSFDNRHLLTIEDDEAEAKKEHNDISCLSADQKRRLHEGEIIGPYGEQIIMLHFRKQHERRGIGNQIINAGHVALTCTDIGLSAAFYSDVLGLP